MMRIRIVIGLLLIGLLVMSCHRAYLYEDAVSLPKDGWSSENFIPFELTVEDTTGEYSIDLFIRNDGRYAFSNLFLFINTYAPTGAHIRDTIECTLADRSGKWLGRGIGGQYTFEIPYKYSVQFPFPGVYRFEIEQGMRQDPLSYITDVGISIKAQK